MKLLNKVERFFLTPASPMPHAVLRITLAVFLLLQAFLLRDSIIPLFSRDGLIQGQLADLLRIPGQPHVGWLSDALQPFGISEVACLYTVIGVYLTSVFLMGVGLYTRAAMIASWFLHWVLMMSAFSSIYGVDMYAHVFLFYLMWTPAGSALSMDTWLSGNSLLGTSSSAARIGLRVMQLHLCISYFVSAIEKLQGVQWRTGEVLWRALTLPIFEQVDMTWLANWPQLLFMMSWSTLILEGCYFVFIWPKATRKLWIIGMCGLHAGIGIFLGLHLFGLVMAILSIVIFGVSPEPTTATAPAIRRPYRLPEPEEARAAL